MSCLLNYEIIRQFILLVDISKFFKISVRCCRSIEKRFTAYFSVTNIWSHYVLWLFISLGCVFRDVLLVRVLRESRNVLQATLTSSLTSCPDEVVLKYWLLEKLQFFGFSIFFLVINRKVFKRWSVVHIYPGKKSPFWWFFIFFAVINRKSILKGWSAIRKT